MNVKDLLVLIRCVIPEPFAEQDLTTIHMRKLMNTFDRITCTSWQRMRGHCIL